MSHPASFKVVDDLLREAAHGRLSDHTGIALHAGERIGPVVELEMATSMHPEQYKSVSIDSPFVSKLRHALKTQQPFGNRYGESDGAFPLTSTNPVISTGVEWAAWMTHAENDAKAHGHNAYLIAALLGALIEFEDNIYQHSGAPETGVV